MTSAVVTVIAMAMFILATDAGAQTAGSTLVGVAEIREVAKGWSAKKQILGQDVYSQSGEKIGAIEDLVVRPDKSISYAIVGAGGFLGMGRHDVAVPIEKLKPEGGKIVLPGVTKETLMAEPKFEYAK